MGGSKSRLSLREEKKGRSRREDQRKREESGGETRRCPLQKEGRSDRMPPYGKRGLRQSNRCSPGLLRGSQKERERKRRERRGEEEKQQDETLYEQRRKR